jgi:hypothetical protein
MPGGGCRFTTFESALACLVSLLLYAGYTSVASAAKWRHDREADALAEPLLSEVYHCCSPSIEQLAAGCPTYIAW